MGDRQVYLEYLNERNKYRDDHKRENNIKIDVTEIIHDKMLWIHLTQGAVTGSFEYSNEHSKQIQGKHFLTISANTRVSRSTLLQKGTFLA
jgi:hypothetical protein